MTRIIKAKVENADEIVSLNNQFHLDMSDFKWDTKEWIIQEIQKKMYYILVDDDNNVLGALHIGKYDNEYYISTIAVKKEIHGKGLGKKLIDFAKELSIKNNIHLLIVESYCEYNLETFYTKCGFTKEKEIGVHEGYDYFKFFIKL